MSNEIYTGIREVVMNDNQLAEFYKDKNISNMINNEYLIIKNENKEVIDKYRFDGNSFVKLKIENIKNLKAKTAKQECCFDLMSNRKIPIKIVAGVPGSGKTHIALKYGFYYQEKGWVNKIFLIRHNVPIGRENGFFKGDKNEKAIQWMGCIKDNIDDKLNTLEELVLKNIIEVDVVETIKGRDIRNSWVLVDEAEDLTEEQFRVIGERISQGSYICFTGDYNQTSQEKYKNNNGLKRTFDKLKGNPLVGFITFNNVLEDDVRSEVSKTFAYYY